MNFFFQVSGWLNGDDFDNDSPPDEVVVVSAANEAQAEDIGEGKLQAKIGRCAVVIAEVMD